MFANTNLEQAIANLTEKIQSEKCFQVYNNTKNLIESNTPLKELIATYKRFDNEIKNKRMNGAEISIDEEKQVSHIYWKLMRNNTARAYLKSEKELITLIKAITIAVFNATKIDIE